MNRKIFLQRTALFTAATSMGVSPFSKDDIRRKEKKNPNSSPGFPVVISTWNHGMPANEEAWKTLSSGGSALDAAEKGVMVVESDKNSTSVGLGGFPDRDGYVTLDASIMRDDGMAGSASFVTGIEHPISLARMIMERTPHVMLVGSGAEQFAREQGITQLPNKLSPAAEKAWKDWLKEKNYKPVINVENHDTIGLLVLDKDGKFAGSCTTSGLAWKLHGRIGDSPVIGAGLFLDNEVGASTCTGLGEAVMRTLASHTAVEEMRRGASPQEACEEAINRIVKKHPDYKEFQVGILAINKRGEHGAYGLQKGFNYALYQHDANKLYDADYFIKS
ncbi:MAG TPA: N(4)-(beta-N-acetylglucosaminyl)-L-asparaginase [Bacteroidia bacterium]|nr:N(4)-(beta-N-acetylglucosaminyl)-L-asparaginase [Bacteroidia bacterium]